MKLNELKPPEGSRKNRKRIGRGVASGHGRTSGRGHKGQLSRSGAKRKYGYEGGQMPLQRRVPKFGFTNIFKKQFQIVNVEQLEIFSDGETINKDTLLKSGIINKKSIDVKILGRGEVKKPLTIEAEAFSKTAIEKITSAGGNIIML